jgi:hypothetical protein
MKGYAPIKVKVGEITAGEARLPKLNFLMENPS